MANESVTSEYLVSGMTCNHCVSSVTEELSELDGVDGQPAPEHHQQVRRRAPDGDVGLGVRPLPGQGVARRVDEPLAVAVGGEAADATTAATKVSEPGHPMRPAP